MKATITERGQVSIPASLRRAMHLKPGQTVLWEKVSANECRLVVLPPVSVAPDPAAAALQFARQHGLEEGRSADYLRFLRAAEDQPEAK